MRVATYQRDKALDIETDIKNVRPKAWENVVCKVTYDDNRITIQAACDCEHKFDIAYCDKTCTSA